MVLRQAEEAAKAGHFEQAMALANRPDVVDHHHAVQLRGKMALDLVARASRRGEVDDLAGAIEDLGLAERLGAAPDTLAAARLQLADRIAGEVRGDLDAGEPSRVVERIDGLAKHKIGGPSLRRTREIAEAWQNALDESRRGEFGRSHDQLDRAERLAAGSAEAALAAARRDMENRQKASSPKVEALYAALGKGDSASILSAAESVLESVPEHPAARQARTRAWQQIAAIGPNAATLPGRGGRVPQSSSMSETSVAEDVSTKSEKFAELAPIAWLNASSKNAAPARPLAKASDLGPKGRFLLWVDAVGGYLVCLDDQVVLGRAGHDSQADVPLMGDLSRNHATIARDGDSYVLRAHQATFVNNRKVESAPLKDGDVIRLGQTLELEFRQPSPVSSSAKLTVVSRHRLPLAVDGVILMAETCIVGETPQSHIQAPNVADPVILYRQGNALWCRASRGFEVDGKSCAGRTALTLQSSVLGDGFSFSLEALAGKVV